MNTDLASLAGANRSHPGELGSYAELMAAKQWHDTKDISYEVVFASANKAHVILRQATRVRADGSPIETVSCFYALIRTPSGWKFFAMSDITIPT